MTPRDKTSAHMKKLFAVAALAAGCTSTKKPDPGYGVVDPMPPPASCPGTAGGVVAKAWFVGTEIAVEIDFARSRAKPAKPPPGSSGEVTIYGGTILAQEVVGDIVRVRVRPRLLQAADLSVPVQCGPEGRLQVSLSWTDAPTGPASPGDGGLPPRVMGPPRSDGGPQPDAGMFAIAVQMYDR